MALTPAPSSAKSSIKLASPTPSAGNLNARRGAGSVAVEKELLAPNIHGETIEYRLSYKHFIPMRWTNTARQDVKWYTQRNIRDWLAEEPAPMSDAEWAALKERLKAKSRGRSAARGKGRGKSASPARKKGGGKSASPAGKKGGGGGRSASPAGKKGGGGEKSASPAGKKGGGGKSTSPAGKKGGGGKSTSPAGKSGKKSASPKKGKKGGKHEGKETQAKKGKEIEAAPEPEEELPKFPSVLILDQTIFPQPRNVLKKGLVRTYDDGRRWMAMFDDGSGSVFHPEGGVAINIIPWQRLGKMGEEIVKPRVWDHARNSFVFDEYADQFLFTAHSHTKGSELIGLFLPTGRTSWFYQTPKDMCHFEPTEKHRMDPNQPRRCRRGRLRLVTDKLMGVQLNVSGDIGNTWRWFEGAPPQPGKSETKADEEERNEAVDGELADAVPGAPAPTPEAAMQLAVKQPSTVVTAASQTALLVSPAPNSTKLSVNEATSTFRKATSQPTLLAEVVSGMVDEDSANDAAAARENREDVDEMELVAAPAIGVIAGKIDRNIGVKIITQEKMCLSFQAKNKLVSFNVGSRITLLSQESVLDSTCKNYKREIRNFRRTVRTLMRNMMDIIPQVALELKLAGKL